MKTYPIMLNLQGRLAAVVGGGPVALRKARALLEAGARVRLIAPDPPPSPPAGLEVVSSPYRADLLEGASLVLACTGERSLNATIAADARRIGALANAADQADDCDFFLPAVHADGPVVVAVGTGGAAPALGVALRDRIARALPPRLGEFAEALARLRPEIRKTAAAASRKELFSRLAGLEGYEAFLDGGEAALERLAGKLLGGPPGRPER